MPDSNQQLVQGVTDMEENKNIIVRSIGILTSGGDAPGMNAVVRGVVRAGCAKGLKSMSTAA